MDWLCNNPLVSFCAKQDIRLMCRFSGLVLIRANTGHKVHANSGSIGESALTISDLVCTL